MEGGYKIKSMKLRMFVTMAVLVFLFSFSGAGAASSDSAYNVQECWLERDGRRIYGELYLPNTDAPHPLVILSHGFGGNHGNCTAYAEVFAAHGFAAYTFDFIGGGMRILSDGQMTGMSVLTEAADLSAVLDQHKQREDIDPDRIFLFGESQGGFVSTCVAASRPDEVAGLVALYPACVIQDDAKARTPDPEDIPETMSIMGMRVGAIYNQDALSFDIYDVMAKYPGKTLIIHGTADTIVPISYSEKAMETFPDAELIRIDGANHGFWGDDQQAAAQAAVTFIETVNEDLPGMTRQ